MCQFLLVLLLLFSDTWWAPFSLQIEIFLYFSKAFFYLYSWMFRFQFSSGSAVLHMLASAFLSGILFLNVIISIFLSRMLCDISQVSVFLIVDIAFSSVDSFITSNVVFVYWFYFLSSSFCLFQLLPFLYPLISVFCFVS